MEYKIELHCHNCYSNGRGSPRFLLDSPMSPFDQLSAAYKTELDAFFITNHNTLDGYNQLLQFQKDHPSTPMSKIKVFQGVETSAYLSKGRDGHVLSYGVNQEIPSQLTVEETVDITHSQGGLTSAPHPYGMVSSIFDQARHCDMVEVRNANNVDIYSDYRAHQLVKDLRRNGMNIPATAGSDAHFDWAMGKFTTVLKIPDKDKGDVSIGDILSSLRKKDFVVADGSRYNTRKDIGKVVYYQLSDSPLLDGRRNDNGPLLYNIEQNHGPRAKRIGKYFIDSFEKNPNSPLWSFAAWAFENRMRNISKKVNAYGYDDSLISASWNERVRESFMPLNEKKSVRNKDFRKVEEDVRYYLSFDPQETVNVLNDETAQIHLVSTPKSSEK